MTNRTYPVAVIADEAPPRTRSSSYPEHFATQMAGRRKQPLGELFGLTNFGVNLTRLAPQAVSALRHAHTKQDEFIYVLPEDTLKVANSPTGGRYPPGSVVQLVPSEVMVKHKEGFSPATNDWEFFELSVSETGSKIKTRGVTEVVNRFGGNCFGCHVKAKPEWDLICEKDHGCAPLPIPASRIIAVQKEDPRCKGRERAEAALQRQN
jgi:hypothetical protein